MEKTKGLNGTQLKLLALLIMLVDHIGMVLFPKVWILRAVGRLAFPIFCFCIVEGYFHTHDVRKYIFRLGIFALVAEIPFNLAKSSAIINIYNQNVFFTLLIGLLMIYFMETKPNINKGAVLIIAAVLAVLIRCDYDAGGILMIYFFYEFRDNPRFKVFSILGLNICLALFSAGGNMKYLQALAGLALIPISFYNGEKGKGMKYLFYLFYPMHFLVLFFIKTFLLH